MKNALVALVVVVLVGIIGFLAWQNHSLRLQVNRADAPVSSENVKLLWMDDIAYPKSGEEFENAIAMEPTCHGLTFRRWNNTSDPERLRAIEAPHWHVFYNGSDGVGRGFIQPIYSVTVQPSKFAGLEVSKEVQDAAEAARIACFVASQKGAR